MDPYAPPATPGADAQETSGIGDGNADSSGWPVGRPTREALDFLEQALTTGVPKPCYAGPIRRRAMPDGRRLVDKTFTLPLDVPLHALKSTAEMDYVSDCLVSTPEPGHGTAPPEDLTKIPADAALAAVPIASQDPTGLAKTTSAMPPPRGIPSRPKPRGILRNETSSPASTKSPAPGKGAMSKKDQDDPSSARRNVKFQLPQGEAESIPAEEVEAKPKRIIKIKSREAVLYWRKVQPKK